MAMINHIFTRLEKLIRNDGQSEFISVLIANLVENKEPENSTLDNRDSYCLLKAFLDKIFEAIDCLSTEILKDDTILVSVKNQKTLRTCFQLITSLGIATSLIPGLGISLSKRCSSSNILPVLKFKDEEKYALLVACTNFFTRSYRVPVLKSIIITLHLSDYLAALIQLAFAPLKKPGTYSNFVMSVEMSARLEEERKQFISTYNHLVTNCFQPTLMKELLVLQSVVDPPPPAFAKRVISKELSQRLLAPGGILSLIRCFIESYEIDSGLEWKKIDMICRLITAKHGTISEEEYLTNVTEQLSRILCLNNTHYLTTAVACVLCLYEKYPASNTVTSIIKDIFHVFDIEYLQSKSQLPGTLVMSPQDIDHKVNILHACINTTKLDWDLSLMKPNIEVLFLIGVQCKKSSDLKIKLKEILVKCLQKFSKTDVALFLNKMLLNKNISCLSFEIIEYESGVGIKSVAPHEMEINKEQNICYFLEMVKTSSENELVKSVFEASLNIVIELSIKRKTIRQKDFTLLEEEPVLLNETDEQYAAILQLLSEISTLPRIIIIIKADPSLVIHFVEHFISRSTEDEECTSIALVLLNTVLSNSKKSENLENIFISLKPMLLKMSKNKESLNHILCKEALSLISSEAPLKEESACGKALANIFDNLLPVRAHGVIELTKLIDAKDPETISKKHYIFCIFQEQLRDPDSYIYLSAINGLAALGTHCTEDVLSVLCNEFLQISSDQKNVRSNDDQNKVAELRMKIGDVIVKVIKNLGEMAVVYKTILLNTMLCGCRDDDPLIRASALSNLAEIARVLHYKIGTIIYEVLLCIWSIIETDKAVECRRAAVMVISSLLKGLGQDTLLQLKDNLLPIYRTLKTLYNNDLEDSIVRLHAQIALEELNDIVNQFLHPELKMEKRIFVLDKPDDVFK